ncbi:MAG: hypothetical protein CVU28_05075 [Betaproteobacteria bacterium HGW-Betaproteobacteria-21]|nr:MAG: hypothetical protein CVU28_05075 [Betaproteobacteria bacterium HGW-Betaproteobacteria-21]
MNLPSVRLSIIVTCIGLALALVFAPSARSQLDLSPSYVPIGVSSSGNSSTAWFHQPSSRTALACQTVSTASGLSSIQCVTAKLP